jgi:hypothetical protein
MNILINTFDSYLVIININTQYAIVESIPDKSTASILSALKSIFKKLKIKSLESDEEASFVSKLVLKYLKKNGVDYYVATEQRHNNLSIVNRFMRTLRDWMRENKPMNNNKIVRFIKTYNGTIHQTTGVSPAQMQDNKDIEVQYIIDSISKQHKI